MISIYIYIISKYRVLFLIRFLLHVTKYKFTRQLLIEPPHTTPNMVALQINNTNLNELRKLIFYEFISDSSTVL